jgi:hypothetical protein
MIKPADTDRIMGMEIEMGRGRKAGGSSFMGSWAGSIQRGENNNKSFTEKLKEFREKLGN